VRRIERYKGQLNDLILFFEKAFRAYTMGKVFSIGKNEGASEMVNLTTYFGFLRFFFPRTDEKLKNRTFFLLETKQIEGLLYT